MASSLLTGRLLSSHQRATTCAAPVRAVASSWARASSRPVSEATVVATRRFARRQDAWFRKDERISWFAHDRPDLVDAALVVAGPEGRGRSAA